jgi:site-specific recombinase XerD
MTKLRKRLLEELQRRNYSAETVRGYILAVKQFAEYFYKSPDQLGAEHLRRFQLYLLQEKKLAPGTVEARMSALRFFFKKTLKHRDVRFDDLPFPKTPRRLPTVLSPEDVTRLIEASTNIMHQTMLMVLYGTGMRRTEVSVLKVSDIDSPPAKPTIAPKPTNKTTCDRFTLIPFFWHKQLPDFFSLHFSRAIVRVSAPNPTALPFGLNRTDCSKGRIQLYLSVGE